MSPWSLSKYICSTGPFCCIPNQINHPCSSLKTCDSGGSSSASSKNSSLPVYSVSSSFSSSAATTKAFPTFLSAPTLIQVRHVLMELVMNKFLAISREVDCPTSCLSFKLRMWVALKLIKSRKISKNSFLLEIYRTLMMVMMIIMMTMMMNSRWKLARWRC